MTRRSAFLLVSLAAAFPAAAASPAQYRAEPTGAAPGGAVGEIGSIDMLFSTESVADALSPLAVAFDGGYVASQGDIDELFGGASR